ncbi:MAG: hypothetical protein JWO82_4002 [Akkermansiaceae bacterium]|nr:hypothetical protein [Akkermansiaceae bacterium]
MDSSDPYQTPVPTDLSTAPKLTPKQILTSFDGRIPRKTFWLWGIGFGFAFGIVLGIVTAIAGPAAPTVTPAGEVITHSPGPIFFLLMLILAVPYIWVILALQIKRWHDRDKPGTWVLIGLIPIVGIWALIETGFLRGTVGPNQYGPDPTEP